MESKQTTQTHFGQTKTDEEDSMNRSMSDEWGREYIVQKHVHKTRLDTKVMKLFVTWVQIFGFKCLSCPEPMYWEKNQSASDFSQINIKEIYVHQCIYVLFYLYGAFHQIHANSYL